MTARSGTRTYIATSASMARGQAILDDFDRDRAAEARHGGRYITGALARAIDNPTIRARFSGAEGPEALADAWRYTASPSGSNYPASGRDTTQRYAVSTAAIGGVAWEHSAYWRAPRLPESAFDWPIYRAALIQSTDDCQSNGHRDV